MKMMRRIAVLAMLFAAVATTSLTAAQPAAADTCGFHYEGQYYRHCGNSRVVIQVKNFALNTWYKCVGPGNTYLGNDSWWLIVNARYVGLLC